MSLKPLVLLAALGSVPALAEPVNLEKLAQAMETCAREPVPGCQTVAHHAEQLGGVLAYCGHAEMSFMCRDVRVLVAGHGLRLAGGESMASPDQNPLLAKLRAQYAQIDGASTSRGWGWFGLWLAALVAGGGYLVSYLTAPMRAMSAMGKNAQEIKAAYAKEHEAARQKTNAIHTRLREQRLAAPVASAGPVDAGNPAIEIEERATADEVAATLINGGSGDEVAASAEPDRRAAAKANARPAVVAAVPVLSPIKLAIASATEEAGDELKRLSDIPADNRTPEQKAKLAALRKQHYARKAKGAG